MCSSLSTTTKAVHQNQTFPKIKSEKNEESTSKIVAVVSVVFVSLAAFFALILFEAPLLLATLTTLPAGVVLGSLTYLFAFNGESQTPVSTEQSNNSKPQEVTQGQAKQVERKKMEQHDQEMQDAKDQAAVANFLKIKKEYEAFQISAQKDAKDMLNYNARSVNTFNTLMTKGDNEFKTRLSIASKELSPKDKEKYYKINHVNILFQTTDNYL